MTFYMEFQATFQINNVVIEHCLGDITQTHLLPMQVDFINWRGIM